MPPWVIWRRRLRPTTTSPLAVSSSFSILSLIHALCLWIWSRNTKGLPSLIVGSIMAPTSTSSSTLSTMTLLFITIFCPLGPIFFWDIRKFSISGNIYVLNNFVSISNCTTLRFWFLYSFTGHAMSELYDVVFYWIGGDTGLRILRNHVISL